VLADGSWRYCKAAFYSNGKIKPNRSIVGGTEEEHPEGSYYLYHKKSWIPVGADALDAQRRRNAQLDNYELKRLSGTAPAQNPAAAAIFGKTPPATASQQYFSNLEARGADQKTIRTYRAAVEPFIENCAKTYVEDATKQDMINFMGWLRKQPAPQCVLNAMLGRLQSAFDQLRRFTADASHELRTPLTAMRSVGEVALQDQAIPSEYRDVMGSMLEEVDQLTRLSESLLELSRADAGHVRIQRTDIALLTVAQEANSMVEVLAEEKGQRVDIVGDANVIVSADRLLLRQAIANLLDNAIKYSPVNGQIKIEVQRGTKNTAWLDISDEGPGIPFEHQSHVFDRFYWVGSAWAFPSLAGLWKRMAARYLWIARKVKGLHSESPSQSQACRLQFRRK
jgi:signal transduction histidine kinase